MYGKVLVIIGKSVSCCLGEKKKKYLESKKKKILSKIDLMNGIERCIF